MYRENGKKTYSLRWQTRFFRFFDRTLSLWNSVQTRVDQMGFPSAHNTTVCLPAHWCGLLSTVFSLKIFIEIESNYQSFFEGQFYIINVTGSTEQHDFYCTKNKVAMIFIPVYTLDNSETVSCSFRLEIPALVSYTVVRSVNQCSNTWLLLAHEYS